MKSDPMVKISVAARQYNIPYTTIHKWAYRLQRRTYSSLPSLPVTVRMSELERYIWQRAKRDNSGVLVKKQGQAGHALETLRALKQKG